MIKVNRFTLPNGLRVIHHEDSATAMVALNILYNVGSRDESPEMTGMAHLFEHLMFGGSEHIEHYDKELEHAGGTNNAWTNCDYTNFYDIIPGHNVETAFWLESDRMNGLAFSEKALEVQRHVVCEEFKQVCLNQPYGDLSHYLNALAFTTHPYRTPVIGKELSHIERVTNEDVKKFFHAHYAPNNAVLAVTGNISFERVKELTEKWFGPIPRREIAERNYLQEPRQTEPRTLTVSGRAPHTAVVIAYHIPGFNSRDYTVCDTITDLLSAGYASRFYRNLMLGTDLFNRCDASITGSMEPGLLLLQGYLREGVSPDEAIDRLNEEALSLAKCPPDEHELERVKNNYEATQTFSQMSYVNLAANLAQCEMNGIDLQDLITMHRSVTTEEIIDTTKRIITPDNSSTLIYNPI
ncbi:MAG: insulinase family protein [Bacteroides sp.]|nr:insulinase family protein [Bacteroides sp.]